VGDFGDDNRAGIDRTLHRISCMRNRDGVIVGLTCRVGRAISGCASLAADFAVAGKSLLILGKPGGPFGSLWSSVLDSCKLQWWDCFWQRGP
jgi:stage III sporulation protein SpoIIIAA